MGPEAFPENCSSNMLIVTGLEGLDDTLFLRKYFHKDPFYHPGGKAESFLVKKFRLCQLTNKVGHKLEDLVAK